MSSSVDFGARKVEDEEEEEEGEQVTEKKCTGLKENGETMERPIEAGAGSSEGAAMRW